MQGEHRVARWRVVLVLFPTLLGLAVVAQDPANAEYLRGVPINLTCLALALLVLHATRKGERPAWLGVSTVIGDVTLVSLLHVADLAAGHPSAAVNGRVTFLGYFMALVGTVSRWDRRLAWVAGAVAIGQYAAIVAVATTMWPDLPTPDVLLYGQFDAGVQIERLITLGLFSFVCAALVRWSVQLKEHATTDPLTGLINRRTFEERLRDELIRAARERISVSVVMFDADHFKRINDVHGHQAGDLVLTDLARTLRDASRRTDLVARWGGEEFAVAYLRASASDAAGLAESLRERVDGMAYTLPNGQRIGVTISAGVATAPDDGTDGASLVSAADARLLQAKRAGRNRVVGSAAPPIPSSRPS